MALTRRQFVNAVLAGGGLVALTRCLPQASDTGDSSRGRSPNSPESGATPTGSPTPSAANSTDEPAYVALERQGKFADRVDAAYEMYERCRLCPRACGVNRLRGEVGACRAPGRQVVVYSHSPHFGEELPLVGRNGSGTVFFSNCNLRCVFCQNWPIAHEGRGRRESDEALADRMLELQRLGCHNINVVTPTHVMPNILAAIRIAMKKGLSLPICYNTGGYDAIEAVRLLDGIVDIYLPDLKFTDGAEAARYAGTAPDYPETAKAAIAEMHRQVGDLVTDSAGIARRGVMIRHLVMPNRIAGTRAFVEWVAAKLSPATYVNIMAQYRVAHRAFEYPAIARAITTNEFLEAMEWAEQAGLTNLDERSVAHREMFRRRN